MPTEERVINLPSALLTLAQSRQEGRHDSDTRVVVQGVIDWHPLLRDALARATWIFNMPIGNSGAPPRSTQTPQSPYLHVAAAAIRSGSSAPCHLAKLLVYTLRADVAARAAPGGLAPLQALDQITALLEHFYHASNHGRCV
jgi:hypothetical protein